MVVAYSLWLKALSATKLLVCKSKGLSQKLAPAIRSGYLRKMNQMVANKTQGLY